MEQRYKLTVPDVNRLIGCYSHSIQNPEQPSDALISLEIHGGSILKMHVLLKRCRNRRLPQSWTAWESLPRAAQNTLVGTSNGTEFLCFVAGQNCFHQ